MATDFPFEKFLNTKKATTPTSSFSSKNSNKNNNLLDDIFSSSATNNTAIKTETTLSEQGYEENSDISPFKPITDAIFEALKTIIDPVKYNTFIKNKIQIKSLDERKILFCAQTQFIQNTVKASFLPQIKTILKELMGEDYEIEFYVSNEISQHSNKELNLTQLLENPDRPFELAQEKQDNSKKKSSFTLDLSPTKDERQKHVTSRYIEHMEGDLSQSIDPTKTFDNFIVGPSNNLAFATACAVSSNPGKTGKYPSVYFYSDSGLGKTHLLHAVANGIIKKYPDMRICLVSARDFMKELVNACKDSKMSEFQMKYTEHVDILMIDDIHQLKNKKGTQEEFFHVFNFLHDKGKQLIFTSDKSPDQITGIEERIITRLQWGLVVDIQKPDFETRTAILKKKAIDLDLFIQDDVLSLIASSVKTSIRELEGSLIRLQAHAELIEAEIDTEMAREILKLQANNERPVSTLESVCRAASHYFKIPVADLRSKARSKEIVRARHISWYLSKNIVGATYDEIGQYYSNRDHSSVIHGVNKITKKVKSDAIISKDIVYLENNI